MFKEREKSQAEFKYCQKTRSVYSLVSRSAERDAELSIFFTVFR